MRVSDARGTTQGAAGAAQPGRRRFGEALRNLPRSGGPAEAASSPRMPAARRAAQDARPGALRERRAAFVEEERAPASQAQPDLRPHAAEPSVSELRAAVRCLPAAIEASRIRDGAPLALSFGRSLDVEIRAGPTGVEIALRPDARLARAAAAELPALVAALRARGVAVARAEVAARGAPAPRRAR